jgi:sulfide:quinone oxidoreductase
MITRLTDRFSVSPQLFPEDLPLLKQSGYRAIVDNRPDGEEPGQPTSTRMREAAEQLGLRYFYIPVEPGQVTDEDARALRAALDEAEGPVLTFCRTGSRSTKLWERASARG